MAEEANDEVESMLNITNVRLADELEVIRSIYREPTVTITSSYDRNTAASLRLLDLDYHFNLSFPAAYPEEPPEVNGVDHLYGWVFCPDEAAA
jgi:hypothetical protein